MDTNARSMKSDPILDAPELEPLHLREKPDGPGAAAMIAAGLGVFIMGLFTVLAEASVGIHDWLESLDFGQGVGPLAGKTILASAGFFVSWLIFGIALRDKEVYLPKWFWVAVGLGVVGAVMMFPPVFTAFAPE